MSMVYELLRSWNETEGNVTSTQEIVQWIEKRNSSIKVSVEKVEFSYHGFWHYDEMSGRIKNENNSFFQIAGYQDIENDRIVFEQPMILQNEIGYLGMICKKIDGILNFLVQAKIEPGNINVVQLSPTIQATKSNFMQMHGGNVPAYLDYFVAREKHTVIVDQLQSEQSARFYKKRNRNIILMVDSDVETCDSHRWMTLGQIKEFMKKDNLVNMDTRTVLSCIPFSLYALEKGELEEIESWFRDKALFHSMFKAADMEMLHGVFGIMNDARMYRHTISRLLPLRSLKGWDMNKREIVCKTPHDFKVIYCRINIEGREVTYWEQPLLEALGQSVIGLFSCVENGIRKFLVQAKTAPGCFDVAEVAPTIQLEPSNNRNQLNAIEELFLQRLQNNAGVLRDVIMSEEGGRFYHEENRNAILVVEKSELEPLPYGMFWLDFATINDMIQFGSGANIQLRNLMTLLEM